MNAPVVFSPAWFERHQRLLLTLLALPLVGRLMRRLLAIRPHDIGWSHPIVQLRPNAYTVDNSDGTLTTDFRTHAKFGKRLYYQLRPLWRLLHAWDMVIANPLVPALNAGFDTLTVYPNPGSPGTTTVDGNVIRFADEAFATIRNGAGTSANDTLTGDNFVRISCSTTANQYTSLYRSIFLFDTSALRGVVVNATLSLYGTFVNDASGWAPTMTIYASSPASNVALVSADYGQIGDVALSDTAIAAASWAAAYNDFALNAKGLAVISDTGVTKYGARCANYDVANVAPTWASGAFMTMEGYFADQTGTTNDPKLVITYTPSSPLLKPNTLRPRVFAPGRAR